MHHDPEQRAEHIAGLIERYRSGEFSAAVFTASLKAAGVRPDDIRTMLHEHWDAFTQSMPFKRGDVS